MATEHEDVQTLERGNVYFLYRPRVEQEEPEGPQDVQNFYVVLSPHGKQRYRVLVIGRERLPDLSARGRSRMWGFVSKVARTPKPIVDELGEDDYDTKTRGRRHQPAARPAGEGVYQIVRHGDHTHFVYALELPGEPGPVQDELGIESQASYIVSVRNPETPSPPQAGLGPEQAAKLPKSLGERFAGRKFADLDPPEFLDHEGAELVLIAAARDVEDELGIRLEPADEDASSAEIFSDLRLRRSDQPLEPLLEGDWA